MLTDEQQTVLDEVVRALNAAYHFPLAQQLRGVFAASAAPAEGRDEFLARFGSGNDSSAFTMRAIADDAWDAATRAHGSAPTEGREIRRAVFIFDVWMKDRFGGAMPSPLVQSYMSSAFEAGMSFQRAALDTATTEPIPMLLFCPKCDAQHVDKEEWARDPHDMEQGQMRVWSNPPHRSHLCHACGCIWRPADVPTTGVAAIETRGKADSWDGVNTASTMSEAEGAARRALAATDSNRVALIRALQKALAYWMPSVFDDRSAHDAYLLVGYEGETEPRCWGDEMVAARPRWTPVSDGLPAEPGWYLAMLKPDNDWGLMSDTALQVEFDAYISKPKSFTCLYDYRVDEDITEAVTHWMPMPCIDRANAEGSGDTK